MNISIYLSQSYQDAWNDYQRSLHSLTFPVWDYIIITASNEHQAKSFLKQVDARRDYIPRRTRIVVIPDEGGARVGSGGATLAVLRYIHAQESKFGGLRILVIHSGGDSKRVPQYSALGKLFSPVPHTLADGRSSTLFDEFLITMSGVPGRIREGMLLLSGDVLLLFNPLLVDWSDSGSAVISFKEDVQVGKDHGVYLGDENGNVKTFLHKEPVERLVEAGAVNEAGCVDIDTGAILFGVDLLDSLWSLVSSGGTLDPEKYAAFVNDRVRLSLYGDFQYPLATDSTLEGFYLERPEGDYSPELAACRTAVWQALRPYRLKLLRLAPARFIHFGTTGEILRLMTDEVSRYEALGWSKSVNSSMATGSGYNSVVSSGARIGEGCYFEVSYVHSRATIGAGTILSYIDIQNETIPGGVVLHGLKQTDGRFVCRIFGTSDNPKEARLFGREIPESLASDLWTAPVYPERNTVSEAVAAALDLYEKVQAGRWDEIERGKSLASGFNDADPEAILAWNRRMGELVVMNDIAEMIASHVSVAGIRHFDALSPVQQKWLVDRLARADYSEKMRLYYYLGTAMRDEGEIARAFSTLCDAILDSALQELHGEKDLRIAHESVEARLPLRVNFGGGWSDTPPYCNENGGTVLNAAILLNGQRPVSVRIRRMDALRIVFDSRDMDVHGEFEAIEPLQSVGDPFDPCVLQKAALLACGVIPPKGGGLKHLLEKLGGGFWMDTEVIGVPKGSGLGTSSILAAACVKAIFEFFDISYDDDKLYSTVLCMEQLMSTGGGWQDQVGGATDGIKFITSRPGLKQIIHVNNIEMDEAAKRELGERFALIYTGQRRLARNLLRDVVGRYIGNDPDVLFALNEIQRIAALMRFELERGNIDAFAGLLNQHWELSKLIDAGSTNTLIDQIFDACKDLLAGRMICGAGGGGFLQVVLKKGVSRQMLQKRIKSVFSDTGIGIWDCRLV